MVAIVPGIGHGSRVAFDGSRSLEVRDLQVHHNDWCINETDRSTGTTALACHLVVVANKPQIAVQAGDSGGPVYRYIGGSDVEPVATIVSENSSWACGAGNHRRASVQHDRQDGPRRSTCQVNREAVMERDQARRTNRLYRSS